MIKSLILMSSIRFINYCIYKNKLHNGYTLRSYVTSIIFQSFLLPIYVGIMLKEKENSLEDWLNEETTPIKNIFFNVGISYFLSDISNFMIARNRKLFFHHVISIIVLKLGQHLEHGSGYAALAFTIMEFGSLWISIADFTDRNKFMLFLRFFFFTITRIIGLFFTYKIISKYTFYKASVITFFVCGLLYDNFRTGRTMFLQVELCSYK